MPEPIRPTARLRRLGGALKAARLAAGLTLEAAGELLERSPGSLSKIENGRSAVRIPELRYILDKYQVPEPRRERLVGLAENARRKGWWERYGTVLTASYLDYVSLEDDANDACEFEPFLLPGLLQTPDYARAVIEAVPTDSALNVDDLVEVRIARQRALTRSEPRPLHLTTVIAEGALRQQIGGPAVLRRQLIHLTEIAQRDNVSIRVLPFTATSVAGVGSPFLILSWAELSDLDVILVESPTGGIYLEDDDDLRHYRILFDTLRTAALSAPASVDHIHRIARDLA